MRDGLHNYYRLNKKTNEKFMLRFLEENDLDEIVTSFQEIGWDKPRSLYEEYLAEQKSKIRSTFVAIINHKFRGYVTLKWKSDYNNFRHHAIPEIADLNVLPAYRKKGLGSKLIAACETMAKEQGHTQIGLGVGLTADYGNAQRLYVKLGFVPDGHGLFYKIDPVHYGAQVVADDYLVIYLIKNLKAK